MINLPSDLLSPRPIAFKSIDSSLNPINHRCSQASGFVNEDVVPGSPHEDPFHTQHQQSESSSDTDYGQHPRLSVITQFSRPWCPRTLQPNSDESNLSQEHRDEFINEFTTIQLDATFRDAPGPHVPGEPSTRAPIPFPP